MTKACLQFKTQKAQFKLNCTTKVRKLNVSHWFQCCKHCHNKTHNNSEPNLSLTSLWLISRDQQTEIPPNVDNPRSATASATNATQQVAHKAKAVTFTQNQSRRQLEIEILMIITTEKRKKIVCYQVAKQKRAAHGSHSRTRNCPKLWFRFVEKPNKNCE